MTSGDGLLKTSPTGGYSTVTNLLYSSQQVCFIQCFRYSLHKPAPGVAGHNEGINKLTKAYNRINTLKEPRNESSDIVLMCLHNDLFHTMIVNMVNSP